VSVTAALALMSFVVVEVAGMRALGAKGYLATIVYIPHGLPKPLVPIMALIMTPVELLGKLTKPFALAIRLFANMTAGHVLLLAIISLIFLFGSYAIAVGPVMMAIALTFLELFVAFLQAYIFTFLTTLFIGQLVVHEHEHHEDEGGHHDEGHESIGGGDLTDFDKLPEAARHAGAHMAG
jgi:F-type H+-transporting ATPase subunit a